MVPFSRGQGGVKRGGMVPQVAKWHGSEMAPKVGLVGGGEGGVGGGACGAKEEKRG